MRISRYSSLLWVLCLLTASYANARVLRVHLDWIPDAEFAGVFVAMERGWYKKAGIDIELVSAGFDKMPILKKGLLEVGIHSGQDLIRHVATGSPVRVFAANYQISPVCIVVGQDSGINSVKDLKGKIVGVFAPQDYDTYRIMLGNHGLTLDDVTIKKVETINEVEIEKKLRSGELDAITAWEFNWTLTLPLLNHKVRVFPGYDNGFHFYGVVYFAREEMFRKERALLARFLKVTLDGWREVFRDVDGAARTIVDKYYPPDRFVAGSKELTLKQQAMELKLAQRFFFEGVGRERVGWMSEWKWARSIDIARKYGLIPRESKIQARDVFDDSILKGLEKAK